MCVWGSAHHVFPIASCAGLLRRQAEPVGLALGIFALGLALHSVVGFCVSYYLAAVHPVHLMRAIHPEVKQVDDEPEPEAEADSDSQGENSDGDIDNDDGAGDAAPLARGDAALPALGVLQVPLPVLRRGRQARRWRVRNASVPPAPPRTRSRGLLRPRRAGALDKQQLCRLLPASGKQRRRA